MKKDKASVPKRIHCTFTYAEVDTLDPEAKHAAIYAKAEQYDVRMILCPAHIPALKHVLEQ